LLGKEGRMGRGMGEEEDRKMEMQEERRGRGSVWGRRVRKEGGKRSGGKKGEERRVVGEEGREEGRRRGREDRERGG